MRLLKDFFQKNQKQLLILVAVGLVVYAGSLFNNFVWDDEEQILNNVLVHSVKNTPLFFTGGTFNNGGGGGLVGIYYKPLMSLVFSVIYTLFGANAFFFHLFQLGIHIANSIMVFVLFQYFFSQVLKSKNKYSMPLIFSLIFLAHPMNVEAVAYISALQDVLFFFFGMLALLVVIYFDENIHSRYLVPILLLLSILSKETGLVFMAIIFFYLLFFKKERLIAHSIIDFVLLNIYFILRFAVADVGLQKFGISPISNAPLSTRLLSIPKIIVFYIKTFIFPKDLAILQHWLVTRMNFPDLYWPLIVVFVFGLLLVSGYIYLKNKNKQSQTARVYDLFLLWFVLGLGLHLQLFPLDMTVADRWFYLPMVGLLGMIVVVISNMEINLKAVVWFFVIIIVALSLRSIARSFDWGNGLALYSHDIKISRGAFDLENNLGVELFRVGKLAEAKEHFEKSTKLAPYWWTNWNNLGVIYDRNGDFQKAGEYYKKAITNGQYYLAYENYASILIKEKKYQEAIGFLEKQALPFFPGNQKLRELYTYLKTRN